MRYYKLPDKTLLPSVTTILGVIRKPALEHWRGDLGNAEADRQMNEAGDKGSLVHKLCEAVNYDVPWSTDNPDVIKMVEAYEKWFNTYVSKVLYVERLIVNVPYGYAGRVDLVAVLKGDRLPSVIDLKTGNALWPDVPLQLSGYKQALPFKTKWRVIVHLDKNEPGKIVVKNDHDFAHDHERDFRTFTYAGELYRYFNAGRPPREADIVEVTQEESERIGVK